MAHSRLSPSAAHRWMVCPGSPREEAKYPEKSGEAAIDGTHTHTLLEYCIKNNMNPLNTLGKELSDGYGSFIITEDRAERVKVAVDYIKHRVKESKTPVAIRSEEFVDPAPLMGRFDLGGTLDVQLVTDDWLEVIDYKDGTIPVPVVDNPQLLLYAIGALASYVVPGETLNIFPKVRLTVVQPKLLDFGKEPFSSHEYNMDELFTQAQKIRDRAFATDALDAPLVPGETQCKWCRAKPCTAMAEKALTDAKVLFSNVDVANQAANNDPHVMTDGQLLEVFEATPLIRDFLIAVEEEALRRFQTGHPVSGLKVVRGRGSRNWSLEEEEMAKKLSRMGIPKALLYTHKLVSPAQTEKLVWEKKGERKSLSESQRKQLKDNFIEIKEGKLTVVLDSDDRKAVMMDANALFKDVTVETDKPQTEIPDWMK